MMDAKRTIYRTGFVVAIAVLTATIGWAVRHYVAPQPDAAPAPVASSQAMNEERVASPGSLRPATPALPAPAKPLVDLPSLEPLAAPAASALPDPASDVPGTTAALFEELRRVVGAVAERFPDSPDALEMVARANFWAGNSAAAVEAWQKCLQRNSQYLYAYHGLAKVAVKKGKHDEAIELLRKALALSPDSLQTQVELATALVDAGQANEAIAVLAPCVKGNPRFVPALVLMGMASLDAKDFDGARKSYEAAIQLQPQHANAHYGLATACARLGKKEQAREATEKFNRLRAEERRVRKDERATYDDLQEMRALAAELYTDSARLYHARGCKAEAERVWRRAARLDPKAVECRQAVAWACRESGRFAEAIEMLQQLAAAQPANPGYPLEIGRLNDRLGRFGPAEQAFESVCRLAPQAPEGYAALAALYVQSDRKLPEALALAKKAASLKPTAAAHALLGEACRKNGDRAGAAAAFRQALTMEPTNAKYQQALQSLQQDR